MAALAEVRSVVHSTVPGTAISRIRTLDKMISDSAYQLNYSMLMLRALAGLALVLALVGLYGVLSQTVRDRDHGRLSSRPKSSST